MRESLYHRIICYYNDLENGCIWCLLRHCILRSLSRAHTIRHASRLPMPFSIRPHRRFPVQCSATYNAGPFQGHGTIWNLSCTDWRLSGDLPMRTGETLLLTVTLPNQQCIKVPEAAVRWSRGQEFAVENLLIKPRGSYVGKSPPVDYQY